MHAFTSRISKEYKIKLTPKNPHKGRYSKYDPCYIAQPFCKMDIIELENGAVLSVDEFRYLTAINARICQVSTSQWGQYMNVIRSRISHNGLPLPVSESDSSSSLTPERNDDSSDTITEPELEPGNQTVHTSDDDSDVSTCSICLDQKSNDEMCYPSTCNQPNHKFCFPDCISMLAQRALQTRPREIRCPCCRIGFTRVIHQGNEVAIPNVITSQTRLPTGDSDEGCPFCWGIYNSIPRPERYFHSNLRRHVGRHRQRPRNYRITETFV